MDYKNVKLIFYYFKEKNSLYYRVQLTNCINCTRA